MVRKLSQGHGDGHPLMPQHGAEPSLSSSPSDATRTVVARQDQPSLVTKDETTATQTCGEPVVVVVVVVLTSV